MTDKKQFYYDNSGELAELLGLDDIGDFLESLELWEYGDHDEQEYVESEAIRAWQLSLESTAETVFERMGLELMEIPRQKRIKQTNGYSFVAKWTSYRLKPAKSWKLTARQFVEVINGYGPSWFDDELELLRIGPYGSYKQAVFNHFGYWRDYASVYGDSSIESIFDDNMRHYWR